MSDSELRMYFGISLFTSKELDDLTEQILYGEITYRDIAREVGVSGERIRQIFTEYNGGISPRGEYLRLRIENNRFRKQQASERFKLRMSKEFRIKASIAQYEVLCEEEGKRLTAGELFKRHRVLYNRILRCGGFREFWKWVPKPQDLRVYNRIQKEIANGQL